MKLDGTLNRKERQPARTCAKKKAYKNRGIANTQAVKYREAGCIEQYVYQCKTCNKYHLTKLRPEALEDGRVVWEMLLSEPKETP